MNNPYATHRSAAAVFVLQHSDQIDRFCRRFCPHPNVAEDYRADVLLRLLDKFEKLRLDNAKNCDAVISTWLGWQCRAVRTDYVRKRQRRSDRFVDDGGAVLEMIATPEHKPGQRRQLTAANTVSRILVGATPLERKAALVVLHGYNTAEAREHLGITPAERDSGLESLRRRYTAGGNYGEEERRRAG